MDYVKRIALGNGFQSEVDLLGFLITEIPGLLDRKFDFSHGEYCSTNLDLNSVDIPYSSGHLKFRNDVKTPKRGLSYRDVEYIISEVVGKPIFYNNYEHKYASSGVYFDTPKICESCWNESQYMRFFWNISEYHYCHIHSEKLLSVKSGDVFYVSDLVERPESEDYLFFLKLVRCYHSKKDKSFDFFSIEKEAYLKNQELRLIEFLSFSADKLLDFGVDTDYAKQKLSEGENIRLLPRERLVNILSNLSKESESNFSVLRVYLLLLSFLDYHFVRNFQFVDIYPVFLSFLKIDLDYYIAAIRNIVLDKNILQDFQYIYEHSKNTLFLSVRPIKFNPKAWHDFDEEMVFTRKSFEFFAPNFGANSSGLPAKRYHKTIDYLSHCVIKAFDVSESCSVEEQKIFYEMTGLRLNKE